MTLGHAEVTTRLRALVDGGQLDLPFPGEGRTRTRHHTLRDLARRHPVSVARLAEAHVDALAILHEASRPPEPDALYGVWASSGPGSGPIFDVDRSIVEGTKHFCSGLDVVDRALVTVVDGSGAELLLDLAVAPSDTVATDGSAWSTPALADTATGSIIFTDHPTVGAVVHTRPRWYLERPGFWHGACGPASCWAGAALGLVDVAEAGIDDDPHRRAHLGAMRALAWNLAVIGDHAGDEIDAAPHDGGAARRRALSVRHLTERACTEIVDRFGRALGPRPFVADAAVAERTADLHLYLRQHHGERDLHMLGEDDVLDER